MQAREAFHKHLASTKMNQTQQVSTCNDIIDENELYQFDDKEIDNELSGSSLVFYLKYLVIGEANYDVTALVYIFIRPVAFNLMYFIIQAP